MAELSKEEEHYFNTGGDVTEGLAKEHAAPVEVPPEAAPDTPVVESPPLVPDQSAAEADDDGDEPAAPAAPADGQQPPQRERRRVSRREFESEREARLAAEQRLQAQAVENARVAERLSLLQQALQEPGQPEPQAPARPDPEQDIFGYTRWLEEQLNTVTSKVNTYEEQIQTGQAEMDNERRYLESLNAYAGQKQDFVQAYNYLLRSRAAELTARSYGDVTQEQLQAIQDGRMNVPKPIVEALRQEERDLYRGAFEANRDPAATIYQYATMRGYRAAPAQPPAAPPAPAAGTPGMPLGGRVQAQQPTATQIIEGIQRGQAASQSLSNAGGAAPDAIGELTPQAVANMSEAEFSALVTRLQDSGDRERLMQIFGH